MARGPTYNVPYRRRRQGKTNYKLRKKLVSSGLPRYIIRKTNRYIMVQVAESAITGDKVVATAHSKDLRKNFGYLGSLSNVSAAYLTGLLCGRRSLMKNIKKGVLDVGLQTPSKGCRVFASLKGLIDSGIDIAHNEEIFPDNHRISGEHVTKYAEEMLSISDSNSEIFLKTFSHGFSPDKMLNNILEVKARIMKFGID